MEYYRRNILPDQVRYYRGVFERRRSTRAWPSATWCRPSRLSRGCHRLSGNPGVALDIGRGPCRLSPDRRSVPTGQAPGTAETARSRPARLAVSSPANGIRRGGRGWPTPTPVAGTGVTEPLPRRPCHRRPASGSTSRRRPWPPSPCRTRRIHASRTVTRTKRFRFSSPQTATQPPGKPRGNSSRNCSELSEPSFGGPSSGRLVGCTTVRTNHAGPTAVSGAASLEGGSK